MTDSFTPDSRSSNGVIQKALKDRGVPQAIYDFIKYNLGEGAALAAVLSGKMREHHHTPGGECQCS
jgi:hypothetical protein